MKPVVPFLTRNLKLHSPFGHLSQICIQVENLNKHILWINEYKGPKGIWMTLNIQELNFSVNIQNT